MSDPLLDVIGDPTDGKGYKILCWDDRCEFPAGCTAVRIGGPGLPGRGLPFCVPEQNRDDWARRWVAVLNRAFIEGQDSVLRVARSS